MWSPKMPSRRRATLWLDIEIDGWLREQIGLHFSWFIIAALVTMSLAAHAPELREPRVAEWAHLDHCRRCGAGDLARHILRLLSARAELTM